jgi:transcriptional regulator with XRE-family HTH domain
MSISKGKLSGIVSVPRIASQSSRVHDSEMKFPEKLVKLIETRETNQSRLSRQTGISQPAISQMTTGNRRPYMDQSLLLARALNVPLDFLADDTREGDPPLPITDEEKALWLLIRAVGADVAFGILARSIRPEEPKVLTPMHASPGRDADARRTRKGTG